MSKQFIKGNVYVFTKKKVKQDTGSNFSWQNSVNGMKIIIKNRNKGFIMCNMGKITIFPEWCKCIENNIVKSKKYIYVFDYKRFLKDMKQLGYSEEEIKTPWANECDGKEVVLNRAKTGYIKETPYFGVCRKWCRKIEIKEK